MAHPHTSAGLVARGGLRAPQQRPIGSTPSWNTMTASFLPLPFALQVAVEPGGNHSAGGPLYLLKSSHGIHLRSPLIGPKLHQ